MQVVTTRRADGRLRHRLVGDRERMLVDDAIRRCVAFLWTNDQHGARYLGTGFFVGIKLEELPGKVDLYLVTADHVLNIVRNESVDRKVCVRLNTKDGGSRSIETNVDDWSTHPTEPVVDVAVIRMVLPSDVYDYRNLMGSDLVNEETISRERIGIADEVFTVGLFRNHTGQKRIIPVLRAGNICAMPEEKISTKRGDMDAYLIEARSIGGLSGSPVFVHLNFLKVFVRGEKVPGDDYYLLGLIHGHFDLPGNAAYDSTDEKAQNTKVNAGVAIVVPSSKILEVINQDDLLRDRNERLSRYKEQMAATPDSSSERIPFNREDFENALSKVSRRVAEPDEGTS